MAKKESRISINKLESTMQEQTVTIPLEGTEDVNIVIRKTLPLKDMMQFVEDIVSSCVGVQEQKYMPEIIRFMLDAGVLTRYANFNLPSNIEKQHDLIYNTGALEQVKQHINLDQFYEIETCARNRIAHEAAIIESAAAVKVNELLARFEAIADQLEGVFGGVNTEEINALVQNLAGVDALDEEAMARAVLSAQEGTSEGSSDNVVVFPKGE